MTRIIAPTDFSLDGYNATLVAMQLARLFGWEVIFAHALASPPVPANAPAELKQTLYKEEVKQTQNRLRESCQHLLDILNFRQQDVQYKTLVVHPPFAEAMLRLTKEQNASLIIMGSKGTSSLKRFILGSNTVEMMRLTKVPLLVIPSETVFNGFKQITVLLRPQNNLNRPGLRLLEQLAKGFSATLHFLVISEDGLIAPNIAELLQVEEHDQPLLHFPGTTTVIPDTDLIQGMEQHLAYTSTDLLVLFPRPKTVWLDFITGSLSEELASKPTLPLLIFPVN